MLSLSLRGLAVAAIAAVALGPAPAGAATPVSACGALTKAGERYVLTGDIGATGDCFLVLADRVTLDLAGHAITGPGAGTATTGVGDESQARTLTVVKNGRITGFNRGIDLQSSTRSSVLAVDASDNRIGIFVGPTSLVKDCVVQRNLGSGIIVVGDGVQVEGCAIGGEGVDGNGLSGLSGGARMLVTRNTVIGNFLTGITVGANSTVTQNTSSENGIGGIAADQRSLVTGNIANDNNVVGIDVACPSTVTNNQASNNGDDPFLDFNFHGAGCFEKNNTSPEEGGCFTGGVVPC